MPEKRPVIFRNGRLETARAGVQFKIQTNAATKKVFNGVAEGQMPGAPQFGNRIPIAKRSTTHIVIVFFAFPVIAGLALMSWTMFNAIAWYSESTNEKWLGQVAFGCILGLLMMTALPAVGWQELRRRRKEKEASLQSRT